MQLHTNLGTIDQVFDLADPKSKELIQLLHKIILDFDPDVHVVPRPGEKSIAYGVGPKKMSEAYCYLMPQKDYVNLGFYHGVNLDDPKKLLEGTGTKLRHVKIRDIKTANSSDALELIKSSKGERVQSLS